jgi:5-formyltetrahydrofolate cyclo-ligase
MADPTRTALDKAGLRRTMRGLRRSIVDRERRSEAIWAHVREIPAVVTAERVMLFESVPGEPECAPFEEWCRREGKEVAMATTGGAVDPPWPDVVVVPGLAFTADGDRLGQGGGWYDRFLMSIRADCTTIGVGFVEQIVDALPTEPHDVRLDHVVTDRGPSSPCAPTSRPR